LSSVTPKVSEFLVYTREHKFEMDLGRLASASEVTGHSGSSLDIKKKFLLLFFVSYVSLNLSDDVFEGKNLFFS
jgi:hypothetical protein